MPGHRRSDGRPTRALLRAQRLHARFVEQLGAARTPEQRIEAAVTYLRARMVRANPAVAEATTTLVVEWLAARAQEIPQEQGRIRARAARSLKGPSNDDGQ